jgi:hypothetical protein
MLNYAKKLFQGSKSSEPAREFLFERPLVILQSDDWGRVGVRDQEGYEQLRTAGIRLGENPYDFYTLETTEDVLELRDLLKRHRDSTGRSACLVMNFLLANLDFSRLDASGSAIRLLPLAKGLPGGWKRPGLFESYREGIADGIFYPALHGLTHFCVLAAEQALLRNEDRAALLRKLWKAETPYIYWRMPWIGYEYNNPERPQAGFLSAESQQELIQRATGNFASFFSKTPLSACAPGYRANRDTHAAWAKSGLRVTQNGSGSPLNPHMDEHELLNLYRTIDIEPSQRDLPIEKYMQLAKGCFDRGMPAIVSIHSINFHSTLKDFRTPTLQVLDQFLSALETSYPNLLYVHDGDLYDIVRRGRFRGSRGQVSVKVKQKLGVQ